MFRFYLAGLPSFAQELLEASDSGSGSGGVVDGGGGGTGVVDTQVAEPSVIDLSDDNALIRVKGSEKPVKFGEHVRGFQSQFTKASQEAARLKKELETERSTRQRYEQERQQQQRQGQGGQAPSMYDALAQLPYLSGKDAAEVVQSIAQQIQQRDQVLLGTLKQLQQMQQIVRGLNETHSSTAFDSKIAKFVADSGYDASWNDWAAKLYLAYEGDDLDTEFPRIFAEEASNVERLIDARRTAKVNAARKSPFVPGKGGNAGPSKPMQLDPRASSSQVVDALWESMQSGDADRT